MVLDRSGNHQGAFFSIQPSTLGHLDNAFHVIGVLIYLRARTVVRPLRSDCSLPPLADQFPLNSSNRKLVRQGRDESRVEEDPFVKYQVAEPEIVGIAPSGITVALAELAG